MISLGTRRVYEMMLSRKFLGLAALLLLQVDMANLARATITMDFVTVGDPGNLEHQQAHQDGTIGYGAVDYVFQIGEFEVTNAQYTEFLNAVAVTDANNLYRTSMSNATFGGINRSGSNGNYSYSLKPFMADKPVNYMSWYSAARFANWMHNGQPTGTQGPSTTEDGAYTFTGIEELGPRNAGALFYIPNEHEWQKAAFYEPGAATNSGDEYWLYATGSDVKPLDAFADPTGNAIDPGPHRVVHGRTADWNGSTVGNVLTVGSAGNQSYYGAKDMAGNVFEWVEADPNKPDPFVHGPYIVRGGSFLNEGHLFNTERNNGPKLGNGVTDGLDFLLWQQHFGIGPDPLSDPDFNNDLSVDGVDLAIWEASYGIDNGGDAREGGHIHNVPNRTVGFRLAAQAPPPVSSISVPEPESWLLLSVVLIALLVCRVERSYSKSNAAALAPSQVSASASFHYQDVDKVRS